MKWSEAFLKFSAWHQKDCPTDGFLALGGVAGCMAKDVWVTAELQCNKCKDKFHLKYKT